MTNKGVFRLLTSTARWLLGIFFLLVGIGFLTEGNVLSGISLLLGAVMLIPPLSRLVLGKLKIRLSPLVKTLIVFVLFVLSVIFYERQLPESQSTISFTPATAETVTEVMFISPTPELVQNLLAADKVMVERVIDGDTIVIEGGDKVRYIGIDTPETVYPNKPVECFGKEATAKNTELVGGKKVRLEKDISEKDQYGRLLRYVWVENVLVNQYLIEEGFASSMTVPPDIKYQEKLLDGERIAREEKRGLWGDTCTVRRWVETSVKPTSATYNCSSNSYNCDDFSTHSEAQRVFETCGGINNDIHRLDRDKDGVACETLP